MLNEGVRQLDLYDVFTILIPGAALIVGLYPFLPKDSTLPSTPSLVVILGGGFIVGRGIHALALWGDNKFGGQSHRELFVNELCDNSDKIADDLKNQFYDACTVRFEDSDLPDDRGNLDSSHEDDLEMLYTLVRSFIHMDARGRSRTYQAILDFYRSTLAASLILLVVYSAYTWLTVEGHLTIESVGYQSHLGALNIDWTYIIAATLVMFGSVYGVFKLVRGTFQRHYVEYLFSDLVVLHLSDSG